MPYLPIYVSNLLSSIAGIAMAVAQPPMRLQCYIQKWMESRLTHLPIRTRVSSKSKKYYHYACMYTKLLSWLEG